MLIRNEHGPLLRVVVDAADPNDAQVNAVSFKLDGTDDLGDLDALTLFSTGDKEEFSATITSTWSRRDCAEACRRSATSRSAKCPQGGVVRLRFHLKNARLYAFQVLPKPAAHLAPDREKQ